MEDKSRGRPGAGMSAFYREVFGWRIAERMSLATRDDVDTRFELEEFEDPEGNLVEIIQR